MIRIGSVVNGKYRLVRLLGDGGMGSVYEAQHTVLGSRAAIKVLHPELARRTALVERFLQEARVAAQIQSPHVVHVADVDRTPDGHAYIVMDLLEGEPLSSVLERQHKLPVATACEYTRQILVALEAAHSLGVIHRDLKPENVFVTFAGGRPALKLIDFGIAKAKCADSPPKNLTVAGVVMGTPEYMAPEQARSADKVDARADIYAVGVMLYEMISGARPVSGEDAHAIALRVERGDVVPLVQVSPEVPREIAGLVHHAMAARPELRFATAIEMRLSLERAAERAAGKAFGWPKPATGGAAEPAPTNLEAEQGDAPPVHTERAPPVATALVPPAYGGAAVPQAPPPAFAHHARRGGRVPIVAMMTLPLLLAAGIVGAWVATGTWASSNATAESVGGQVSHGATDAGMGLSVKPTQVPVVVAPSVAVATDVPKLLPVRPPPQPVVPRPQPSPLKAQDAGPPPPVFLVPPALSGMLPPIPSVPPFPTNLPIELPSALPVWPPPFEPSPSPTPTHASGENAPSY